MKFYLVVIALSMSSLCGCNVLNPRQEDKDLSLPKIIGIKQFEDFLRVIERQVLQLSTQLQRIFLPRDDSQAPLTKSEIEATIEQLKNGIKELQDNINVLRDEFSKRFGGLQADSTNSNNNNVYPGVPLLREFIEYISLLQKQIAGLTNLLTRALTGGTSQNSYLDSASDSNAPRIPFLQEFQEFILLAQKQLSRLAESVRRTITIGGQQLDKDLGQQPN